jgi:hypothetical protein
MLTRSSNADRLISAFIEFFGSRDEYVALRKRGGDPGYVHIVPFGFDPSKYWERHVAVDLYCGTIGVTKELKGELRAHVRPPKRIEADPLGYGTGPNYGRFRWALTFDDVEARNGGLRGFVRAVSEILDRLKEGKKLSTPESAEPGDYDK